MAAANPTETPLETPGVAERIKDKAMDPKLWGMLIVALLLGAAGQISMKAGLNNHVAAHGEIGALGDLLKAMFQPLVMLGLGLFVLSSMLYLTLMSKMELSTLYPMVAMNYVFVTILAYFVFKEHVPGVKVLGLAVIIAGVVILSRAPAAEDAQQPEGPPSEPVDVTHHDGVPDMVDSVSDAVSGRLSQAEARGEEPV